MATNNAINLSAQGVAYYNGTGTFSAPTITQHATVIGAANNDITSLAAATNGQVVIGSTGVDPVLATLTQGTGISITNGAGSITIAASGTGAYLNVTGAPQAIAAGAGYITNDAGSLVTYTLPTTAAIGTLAAVVGNSADGWTITYTTGQFINYGSSPTTTTTGSLSSSNQYDSVELRCTVANTVWTVTNSQGNLTVV